MPSNAGGTRADRGAIRPALNTFFLLFGGIEGYREPFTNLVGRIVKSREWLYTFAVLWLPFLPAVSTAGEAVPPALCWLQGSRGTGTASREGKGSCLSPPISAFVKCLFRSRAIDVCQKKELIFWKYFCAEEGRARKAGKVSANHAQQLVGCSTEMLR